MTQARISDFTPDPSNANRGTERGRALLEQSLRQYGAGRSILVDKAGRIIAGNKTLETAGAIGLEDVIVVQTDGRQVVAVQRMDLDLANDEAARMLAYADNRVGEVSLDFDPEQLLADMTAGLPLEDFWRQDELDELLAEIMPKPEVTDAGPQTDRADELRQQWGTELGQLWLLDSGKGYPHRLICGDCTDPATVAQVMGGEKAVLMVTDPPYGVEYDPEWRNDAAEKGLISYAASSVGKVMNDDRVDWSEAYKIVDAQVAYVWHAGRHASEVQRSLESSGYNIVCQIIWAKPVFAISRGDYHWQHEPCWYAVKKGKTHNWQGSRSEKTLWEIGRGIPEKSGHGTEKPIECMAKPIQNNTKPGDIVCDPFAGSGTTGVACQNLGRQARMIEIDPKYCAVILERFKQIGITPTLIE